MQRRGEFSVSVTKDHLVFSSAHFITFAGHRCEGLHGHNYRARVTVEGRLDDEVWFVFDFVAIKRVMKRLCDEIDHKVLLALENPKLLPVPNTTAEMLAELLTDRFRKELESMGARGLTAIEMEVEETFGQSAVYRVALG